jgi:Uma2 family endonuclease
MATAESSVTPEDLLKIHDRPMPELVDGRLVERSLKGMKAAAIATRLGYWIGNHVESHGLGYVLGYKGSYECFPDDPRKVRIPDISFVRKDRMPPGPLPDGHCRVVPDLVVEVVSPNDLFLEVSLKIDDFLAAGVPLVWVVNPTNRTIQVYRADGSVVRLRPGDTLDGGDILPGFQYEVSSLFEGIA